LKKNSSGFYKQNEDTIVIDRNHLLYYCNIRSVIDIDLPVFPLFQIRFISYITRQAAMEIFNRDGIDYTIEDCSVSDIFNYNEILVLKVIREILWKDQTLCRCPICIEDLFALSLNSIPPRYIQITSIEKYLNSANFISEKTIREKVLAAWEKIKAKPGH